jgi:hypothetical protein
MSWGIYRKNDKKEEIIGRIEGEDLNEALKNACHLKLLSPSNFLNLFKLKKLL